MPAANGATIEATRKGLGVKRSELANTVGLTYKSIYGVEKGFNPISQEKAQLIANALGLELDQVLAQVAA